MCRQSTIVIEDGQEFKLCLKCGDYWLNTDEFFTRNSNGHLVPPCRACWEEQRQKTNLEKPCCYPGCTKPRASKYQSRCREHSYYAMRFYHEGEIDEAKYYGMNEGTL